jgi:DNA polymerase-1
MLHLNVFEVPGVIRKTFKVRITDDAFYQKAAELVRLVSGNARAEAFLKRQYDVAVILDREAARTVAQALETAEVQKPTGFDFETDGWSPEMHRDSLSGERVYVRSFPPTQPDVPLTPICFQIFPFSGPVLVIAGEHLDLFAVWLRDHALLDGANLGFEQTVVLRNGGRLPRVERDTIAMDYLAEETLRQGQHDLKQCERDYLGVEPLEFKDACGDSTFKARFEDTSVAQWDVAVEYASFDAWGSSFLADVLQYHLMQRPSREGYDSLWDNYVHSERSAMQAVTHIDQAGMPARPEAIRSHSEAVSAEVARVSQEALLSVGRSINLSSNKELAQLFYQERGYPVTTVTDGFTCILCNKSVNARTNNLCKVHGAGALVNTPKVDEEALEVLAKKGDNVAGLIIERRGLEKKLNSFIEPLFLRSSDPKAELGRYPWAMDAPGNRVWHPALRATHVESGRLSAPLALTLPVEFKDVIGFDEAAGWSVIDCDYSQLELRVMAHLSRDPVLIDAFARGLDMHALTGVFIEGFLTSGERFLADKGAQDRLYAEFMRAKKWESGELKEEDPQLHRRFKWLLERRKQGKTLNFAKIYGAGDDKLAISFAVPLAEAKKISGAVMASYAGMAGFIERRIQELEQDPVMVTLGGRNRKIWQVQSQDPRERAEGERLATNQSCQAGARDIITGAMIQIDMDIEAGGGYGSSGRGSYGFWKQGSYVPDFDRLPKSWREKFPKALGANFGALGRMGARIVNQVHDELVAVAPTPYAELVRDRMVALMEEPWGEDLPLDVVLKAEGTVGLTWRQCKGKG